MSAQAMTRDEIILAVLETIVKVGEVDPALLRPGVDLRQDLAFDSLLGLRVLAALEKRFEVRVPDEEIESCRTVKAAIDLACRLVMEKQAEALSS